MENIFAFLEKYAARGEKHAPNLRKTDEFVTSEKGEVSSAGNQQARCGSEQARCGSEQARCGGEQARCRSLSEKTRGAVPVEMFVAAQ